MKINVKVILIILTILVFSIFLILNITEFLKKSKYQENKTTSKIQENIKNENLIDDKIIIKDKEENIKVLELISHLGFNTRYQSELFTLHRMSNGAIRLTLKEDENNYVLIEKLQENTYYQEYNMLNSKEYLNNNYLTSYKFLKGGILTFLKITKSVNINSQKYEEINANLDYIISSLILTN